MNWLDVNEIMTEDIYLPISLIKHEPDYSLIYTQRFYCKLKCSLLVGWGKKLRRFKELDGKILQMIILGRDYSY